MLRKTDKEIVEFERQVDEEGDILFDYLSNHLDYLENTTDHRSFERGLLDLIIWSVEKDILQNIEDYIQDSKEKGLSKEDCLDALAKKFIGYNPYED